MTAASESIATAPAVLVTGIVDKRIACPHWSIEAPRSPGSRGEVDRSSRHFSVYFVRGLPAEDSPRHPVVVMFDRTQIVRAV